MIASYIEGFIRQIREGIKLSFGEGDFEPYGRTGTLTGYLLPYWQTSFDMYSPYLIRSIKPFFVRVYRGICAKF
jgi:hypothetical protein